MDLSVRYMELDLQSPFVAGASPLSADLDAVRAMERHGAAAVVMPSLFEEAVTHDEASMHHHLSHQENGHAEALSYLPEPTAPRLPVDEYLRLAESLKRSVRIPIIASLNGSTPGGWVRHAKRMEEAGVDGIELNVYYIATDPDEEPKAVEQRYVDLLRAVRDEVRLPVAVKLSPFLSAPIYTAKSLAAAGANGLVLFNRFYQPDIDIEELSVEPSLRLSSSETLRLRLRWLAAISPHVPCSLAATGGVHTGRDALKALMAGATAVQMTSALLTHGPSHFQRVRAEAEAWMEEHEYESIRKMIGSMNLARCPDPAAYERANYMTVLQSYGRP